MKISKIEYENFRNFRDHGEIRCSTDGKVTIIYGKNGDGKTTLHQLFQWVFYGQVHFNKTTTDRLYNLQYESECSFGETFQVMGCIDFEHDGVKYSLRRTYTYKKGLVDSEKIAEDVSLNMMDEDYNWKRLDRPRDTIEKLLPSGLSDYFFFDGESMIADLRVKGKDSAGKLRKALYSMFDLDVIESALGHIGRTDLRTTVLGKLYLSKGTISSGGQVSDIKANIENAQARMARYEADLERAKEKKAEMQEMLIRISEQIGGFKSKADYERQRKGLKTQRDMFLRNVSEAQSDFGDAVLDMFPQLLISKAVEDAKQRIHLKVEQSKLPAGVTKKLITYLLEESNGECICGNPICDNERQHIRAYLDMLPPRSFTSLYQDFSKTARSWGKGYDKARIEKYIMSVLDNNEQAAACDMRIRDLDEAEKKSPDIEDLIVARQQAEAEIRELDLTIGRIGTELRKLEIYLKKQMQDFDKYTKESENIKRLFISALFGGLSLGILFLPFNKILLFIIKISVSILMVLIAFKYKNIKYTLINLLYLYMCSIILGGFLYMLDIEFSYKREGMIFYFDGLSINYILLLLLGPLILVLYICEHKKFKSTYNFNCKAITF